MKLLMIYWENFAATASREKSLSPGGGGVEENYEKYSVDLETV